MKAGGRRRQPSPIAFGPARYCGEAVRGAETKMPRFNSMQPRVASRGNFTRNLGSGLVLVALALSCAACGRSPVVITVFRTEEQAQAHCPSDIVVWMIPQSGAYYLGLGFLRDTLAVGIEEG